MSSKLEEVARALREAVRNTPDGKSISFEEMSFILARAAIEAMREPTQAMIDAGYYPAVQNRGAKSVWPVMIDAALSEEGR